MKLHVIPLKRGLWKTVRMTPHRERRWIKAWQAWWDAKGKRLALSPEMWELNDRPQPGIAGEE